MTTVRPYDPDDDADTDALWELKRAFELELGSATGGESKAETYAAKLTDDYRTGYLEWVERCVAADERCVQVLEDGDALLGYVFVLPETHSYVWDAAVLNEIYVREGARGTGDADDLLAAALDVARAQDLPLDRMVLDVDPANERAQAFYERHGFEHWGELVARDL